MKKPIIGITMAEVLREQNFTYLFFHAMNAQKQLFRQELKKLFMIVTNTRIQRE